MSVGSLKRSQRINSRKFSHPDWNQLLLTKQVPMRTPLLTNVSFMLYRYPELPESVLLLFG